MYNTSIWHWLWWYLQLWWNWLCNGLNCNCKSDYKIWILWSAIPFTAWKSWMGHCNWGNKCIRVGLASMHHFQRQARSLSNLGLRTQPYHRIGALNLAQMDGLLMKSGFGGSKSSLFHRQLLVQKGNIGFWFLMATVVIWHRNLMKFVAKMISFQSVCQHIHHIFYSRLILVVLQCWSDRTVNLLKPECVLGSTISTN